MILIRRSLYRDKDNATSHEQEDDYYFSNRHLVFTLDVFTCISNVQYIVKTNLYKTTDKA